MHAPVLSGGATPPDATPPSATGPEQSPLDAATHPTRPLASAVPRNHPILAHWRQVAAPLGLGLLLLGIIFNAEITAAIHTWIQSTAYNHCFLVIPIVGFLLWERRSDLAGLLARPLPLAGLLGLPIAVVWLVSERLGIMEGRQLAALSFALLLVLAVLGQRYCRAVSGPLLYLYFLVPFGEFLTPKLQDITTFFIQHGLQLLGVPAYIDGYIIEIPQGTFLVAEACAGLRFLIASIAFGCLYALMIYRSPVRRGVFIGVSIVVPIIANGFRGLGIVYLGHLLGSAQAAAADHLIYGWIFFSMVILLLIVLGLPFRQDDMAAVPPRRREPPSAPIRMGSAAAAAAGLLVVAAVSPLLSAALAMATTRAPELPASLDLGPGCTTVSPPAAGEQPPAISSPAVGSPAVRSPAVGSPAVGSPAVGSPTIGNPTIGSQRVVCSGIAMDLTWEAFSPRVTAGPMMQERRRLTQRTETEQFTQSWLADTGEQPSAWQIMRSGEPGYLLAVAMWIDGKPMRPGMTMRLRMALDSLLGTAYAPIIMTVSPAVAWHDVTPAESQQAAVDLTGFLQTHADLDARVAAMAARQ